MFFPICPPNTRPACAPMSAERAPLFRSAPRPLWGVFFSPLRGCAPRAQALPNPPALQRSQRSQRSREGARKGRKGRKGRVIARVSVAQTRGLAALFFAPSMRAILRSQCSQCSQCVPTFSLPMLPMLPMQRGLLCSCRRACRPRGEKDLPKGARKCSGSGAHIR